MHARLTFYEAQCIWVHMEKDGKVAYPVKMAAALSGATVNQLRHWRSVRTGPLLAPEIATAPKVLYSFKDVLALRTCVRLREYASLQKIRGAVQNLRGLGEAEHLASYRLVSDRRGSIQLVTEDEIVNLSSKPGQLQVVAVIGEVIEPFFARAGVLVPHLLTPRPHLAVDPETQGGTPVIADTRVPYDAVAGLMRDGVPAAGSLNTTHQSRPRRLRRRLTLPAMSTAMNPLPGPYECASSSTRTPPCSSSPRSSTY
jgi:DNA-binding transcriptional MerR regulator